KMEDKEVKESLRLQLGVKYAMETDLTARYSELTESFHYFAGQPISIDTASFTDDVRSKVTMPMALHVGGGLNYNNTEIGIIQLGVEVHSQDWSGFKLPFETEDGISEITGASSFHAGLQFIPASDDNFLGRCSYRVGFRQSDSYLTLRDTRISQQAVSFGLTMPLLYARTWSRFHLGFEYGNNGTTNEGLLKENFMNVMVGFTFSPFFKTDEWFIYRQYE
ncbi:MAG: hypothetical protein JNM00_02885, partial [Flavobacteriales bacterium]|nr:hypothetical protein [Flavobacteriales bacterium]